MYHCLKGEISFDADCGLFGQLFAENAGKVGIAKNLSCHETFLKLAVKDMDIFNETVSLDFCSSSAPLFGQSAPLQLLSLAATVRYVGMPCSELCYALTLL